MSAWQGKMIDRLRSLAAKLGEYRRGGRPVIEPHEAEAPSLMADALDRRARVRQRQRQNAAIRKVRAKARPSA